MNHTTTTFIQIRKTLAILLTVSSIQAQSESDFSDNRLAFHKYKQELISASRIRPYRNSQRRSFRVSKLRYQLSDIRSCRPRSLKSGRVAVRAKHSMNVIPETGGSSWSPRLRGCFASGL